MTSLFILGAGFSKGYNPELVPLIEEFLSFAEMSNILKKDDEHKELIEFIERYFGDYHSVNIETLATFLTTELVPDFLQKNGYREKLYRQLISIIISTLGQLYWQPSNKNIKNIFQKFANKVVENNSDIVAFNYDLILDNLLKNTERWSESSGYGVKIPTIPVMFSNLQNEEEKISNMRYLKLHGSLNWGQGMVPNLYGGKEIIISPSYANKDQTISPIENLRAYKSPTEGGAIMGYETFIVPPILSKKEFYANTLFQNIWYTAKEAISHAKEIYVIGYSFPATDFFAEFLFRQSIANRPSEGRKIIIINKSNNDCWYRKRVENIFQGCEFEYKQIDTVEFLKSYIG